MCQHHKDSLRREFEAFREVEVMLKEQEAYYNQELKDQIDKKLRKSDYRAFDEFYSTDID